MDQSTTITYLTLESYHREPIIKSQVESLMLSLEKKSIQFNLVTFEKSNYKCIKYNNITHYQLKHSFYAINILKLIWFSLKMARKGELVHVRSYPPMFAALCLKLLKGNKVIFDPRGLWPEEMSYFENRMFLTVLFRFFEKYFVRYSDSIVYVSNRFAQLFEKRYRVEKIKVAVIPTFSLPLDYSSSIESNVINFRTEVFKLDDAILFVYSGSIEKWQMIDDVIGFFGMISEAVPDARFVFLSKSIDQFRLKLQGKLDESKYIVISAEYRNLGKYLTQCNYGVIFRENHIINEVASPIKIKDYLLSKVKVIATNNIGDTTPLIQELQAGYIMSDLSEKSKRTCIDSLKRDNFRRMSDEALAELDNRFSVNSVSELYHNLYKCMA